MTTQVPSPYETDPTKIPSRDLYADCPLHGRYGPKSGDFQPFSQHLRSNSPESLKYWESLLSECNDSTTLYKNELEEAGRTCSPLAASSSSRAISTQHLRETFSSTVGTKSLQKSLRGSRWPRWESRSLRFISLERCVVRLIHPLLGASTSAPSEY
jgi:hypothetical protein